MKLYGELKIAKDHLYFRIIKRTRPLTIHTECIHKDDVWGAVKKFVNSGKKAIWFVVTPDNFDFVCAESGCSLSEKEWEKRLVERYKWLQSRGQQIEAHVHLRVKMGLYDSEAEARKDIEKKVGGSVRWLRSNGFSPSKIVFGWWSLNNYANEFAVKNGLHPVKLLDYYFIHDYDLLNEYSGRHI